MFLVKFFEQEQYARDFMAGNLHCNTLGAYKNMESVGDVIRGDKDEGTTHWLQPGLVQLQLNFMDSTIDVTNDLAGPLQVRMNWLDDLNLFCMFAGHTGDLDVSNLSPYNLGELRDELSISTDCLEFGNHAVAVTNVTKFFEMVEAAVEANGYRLFRRLVKYYDPDSFHGSFAGIEAAFWKQRHFSYQREYRFAIDTGSGSSTPLDLEIGDLTDLTFLFDSTDIRRGDFLSLRAKGRT